MFRTFRGILALLPPKRNEQVPVLGVLDVMVDQTQPRSARSGVAAH
jgi:hypothetical protein